MLKSQLEKVYKLRDGLTHTELKENITNTIMNIPKEKYRNIIKGSYERPERYTSKKNNIYEFSYKMCVLNEKRFKKKKRKKKKENKRKYYLNNII